MVCEMVVDKDDCERWCVRDCWLTKLVDKDGVWKEDVCEEEAAGGRRGGEEPAILN